ncbi:hypothetical protein RUND412_003169, partial [Rhizina undulata]
MNPTPIVVSKPATCPQLEISVSPKVEPAGNKDSAAELNATTSDSESPQYMLAEPSTYAETINCVEKDNWKATMDTEVQAHIDLVPFEKNAM